MTALPGESASESTFWDSLNADLRVLGEATKFFAHPETSAREAAYVAAPLIPLCNRRLAEVEKLLDFLTGEGARAVTTELIEGMKATRRCLFLAVEPFWSDQDFCLLAMQLRLDNELVLYGDPLATKPAGVMYADPEPDNWRKRMTGHANARIFIFEDGLRFLVPPQDIWSKGRRGHA